MEDLFAAEQKIFEEAAAYSIDLKNEDLIPAEKFSVLVKEYGRLLRQLRRATRVSDRVTGNLNTSKVDLQGKVHYDALTGIYNRRYMEENLKRVMNTVSRSNGVLSVMMLDIDYFKRYNDTYGHSEGDVCLKAVAETLSGCISRADDFVARYGGEEFAVILPNTDESGARIMAGRILEAVRRRNIPHEKNEAAPCVTVSVGVTAGTAVHGLSIETYLKRADEALYLSKQNGRNQYTFLEYKGEV